jgi:acyl carrier protein
VWEQGFDAGGGVGQQQAALALADDEVVAALERAAVLARLPRLAVASGDLPARIAQWTAPLPPRRRAAASRDGRLGEVHAPEDPVERRIAEVWREVLGVPAVGRDDDFFLLGGDSLSGLQVLSKLRAELEVELPLQSFFEARTPAGMAEVVAAERGRQAGDDRRIAELLAEVEGLGDEEVAALLAGEEEGAASEVTS